MRRSTERIRIIQHLLLEMLFAPQELIDEFDEAHGTYELKPPKSASDADNEDLKSRVEALEEVVESLEARTESPLRRHREPV